MKLGEFGVCCAASATLSLVSATMTRICFVGYLEVVDVG